MVVINTKAATPIAEDRTTSNDHPVVQTMPPALQQVYREVRALYEQAVDHEAKTKYAIGQKIESIRDKTHEAKYGDKAVERLAEALGLSHTSLYNWADVARTFTAEEIEAVLARRSSGFRITFTHLVLLTRAPHHSVVIDLLENVFEQRLNTEQLEKLINECYGSAREGSDRVKSSAPKVVLKGVAKASQRLSEVSGQLDDTFLAKVNQIDPKQFANFLDLIETAKQKQEAVIQNAQANIRRLDEARESLAKRQAEAAQADKSPQTPAKAPRRQKAASHAEEATRPVRARHAPQERRRRSPVSKLMDEC